MIFEKESLKYFRVLLTKIKQTTLFLSTSKNKNRIEQSKMESLNKIERALFLLISLLMQLQFSATKMI